MVFAVQGTFQGSTRRTVFIIWNVKNNTLIISETLNMCALLNYKVRDKNEDSKAD
jgi:hypothetical protein